MAKTPAEGKAKKAFKMPHALVIIFVIILAAVLLTWIIPAGSYDRVEDAVTGKMLIDPSSFYYVDRTPVNPLSIMDHVVTGFINSIDLILVILFAGGAFHLVTESGALQASVAKIQPEGPLPVEIAGNRGRGRNGGKVGVGPSCGKRQIPPSCDPPFPTRNEPYALSTLRGESFVFGIDDTLARRIGGRHEKTVPRCRIGIGYLCYRSKRPTIEVSTP